MSFFGCSLPSHLAVKGFTLAKGDPGQLRPLGASGPGSLGLGGPTLPVTRESPLPAVWTQAVPAASPRAESSQSWRAWGSSSCLDFRFCTGGAVLGSGSGSVRPGGC